MVKGVERIVRRISKHLNGGRRLPVCKLVSDKFLDQKVKSIKVCIYIRLEAPKLIRPRIS